MRQYYTNKCKNCPNQIECTGKDRFKIITDYNDVLSKQMALKMDTEKGKLEFAKRKMTVEWPFGNIKQNLKHTEYLTRGIQQTQTENNLICISHNIKRIHKETNQTNNTKN
jgi:transposase